MLPFSELGVKKQGGIFARLSITGQRLMNMEIHDVRRCFVQCIYLLQRFRQTRFGTQ